MFRGGSTLKVPQIRMESQFARIGMNQTMSVLHIEQKQADISIEQPPATLKMETKPGKLAIDQTLAWEQTHLKSTIKHIEDFANEGLRAVAEGIARRAAQGDELMQIEKGGNPIASQAIQNGFRQQKQLGITFMPQPFSVKLHYDPAEVQIDVEPNKPIIDVIPNRPEITFERGNVEIYMEQYEELHIDYVNLFSATI